MNVLSKKEIQRRNQKRYYEIHKEKILETRRSPEFKERIKKATDVYRSKNPWNDSMNYAKRKCVNTKHPLYRKEGALGIKFELSREDCKEVWLRDNAGEMRRPMLMRIDPNLNYVKSNVYYKEKYVEVPSSKKEEEIKRLGIIVNEISKPKDTHSPSG